MPNIKIKNRQGEPIQYDGIDIVSVPLVDGSGYQRYITETQFITTEPLSVTENGVYTADPNTAYTPVTVNVVPPLQSKEVTPTTSEQEIVPDDGYYGLDEVVVGAIQTEEKTVTENGEVLPSSGKYLSKVTVDVPLPSGRLEIHDTNVQDVYDYAEAQVVDVNLIPQNIVKNVPILGVVGTRETGGDVSVEGITITANGTYNAPAGKAYTPVMVNVDSLPPVTEDDNGMVLIVEDGEWVTGSNGMIWSNGAVMQDNVDITNQLPYSTQSYVTTSIANAITDAIAATY